MRVGTLGLSRLAVIERLPAEYGGLLSVLPWWHEALTALDDATTYELVIWLKRQQGKSQFLAAVAASELLTRPGSYTVFVAACENQAAAIYERKLRKPLERLARELGIEGSLRFTKRGMEVPDLGSALEVVAPNEATGTGRSPTLLILDEARDIADGTYAALTPSVIGAGGKIIVASTAGRPTGFFYELTRNPTEGSWLLHSDADENPHADRGVLGFLRRRLSLLVPSAARRELDNEFTEDGESFLAARLIEAAVDDRLGDTPFSSRPAFAFVDLSRKHDVTSIVVVVRDDARQPEAADHLVVASIQTWNPKDSPTGEVDFTEVRAALTALPRRFPAIERVLVDEGAEAGAVLPFARSHPRLSLLVEGFIASPATNMELWGALSARLHAGTISIPRHERLLAELRGLRQESLAFGSKWRVVDSSRRLHRDVSVGLAGACYAAGSVYRCPKCGDEQCDGTNPPLAVIGGSAYRRWVELHEAHDEEEPAPMPLSQAQRAELWQQLEAALVAPDDAAFAAASAALEQYVGEIEQRDPSTGRRVRDVIEEAVRRAGEVADGVGA